MKGGEASEEETIINLGRSLTNNIDLEGNWQRLVSGHSNTAHSNMNDLFRMSHLENEWCLLLLMVVSICKHTDSLRAVYFLLLLPTSPGICQQKMQMRLGRLFSRLFSISLLSAFAVTELFSGLNLPESSYSPQP